jgi:hypothetical protein
MGALQTSKSSILHRLLSKLSENSSEEKCEHRHRLGIPFDKVLVAKAGPQSNFLRVWLHRAFRGYPL